MIHVKIRNSKLNSAFLKELSRLLRSNQKVNQDGYYLIELDNYSYENLKEMQDIVSDLGVPNDNTAIYGMKFKRDKKVVVKING